MSTEPNVRHPPEDPDRALLARIEAAGGTLVAHARGWRLRSEGGRAGRAIGAAAVARLRARGLLVDRPGGGLHTQAARRRASAKASDRRPPAAPEDGRSPVFNAAESPLAWLRSRADKEGRPLLSADQFVAGERLRSHYERALLAPRVTTAWEVTAGGGRGNAAAAMTDGALSARRVYEAALAAVGPELSGILVQVCCLAAGIEQAERILDLPQRSGKAVLRLALTALARHYGLAGGGRAGPLRHWAADGYRPDIPPGETP